MEAEVKTIKEGGVVIIEEGRFARVVVDDEEDSPCDWVSEIVHLLEECEVPWIGTERCDEVLFNDV